MNVELRPFALLPDCLRNCVKDEHRTVFLKSNEIFPSNSVVSLKAIGKIPEALALSQVVSEDVFSALLHQHGEFVQSRETSSSTASGNIGFISASLLNHARPHPVAFPGGLLVSVQPANSISSVTDIPVADQVHIQFCGGAQVGDDTDDALKVFFTNPRHISVGWVFAVPAKPDNESLFAKRHLPRRLTYFKVVSIHPQAAEHSPHLYQVNATDTSLVQDAGRANCPVPSLLEVCASSVSQLPLAGADDSSEWSPCVPPGLTATMRTLQQAVLPAFSSHCLPPHIRPTCHLVLTGHAGSGKKSVVRACCRWLGVNLFEVNSYDLQADTVPAGEVKIKTVFDKARARWPAILYFSHAEVLARRRDSVDEEPRLAAVFKSQLESLTSSDHSVVVLCSCSKQSLLAPLVAQLFYLHVAIEVLSVDKRLAVLQYLITGHQVDTDVKLLSIAEKLQGAVLSDLSTLCTRAVHSSQARTLQSVPLHNPSALPSALGSSGISMQDWLAAVKQFEKARSKELGAPKVPEVHWEDVGGLSDVRQEILDTIQLPLEHPHLFASGLKRSGILLYGPPGCGKTLLAKAVATECSLNFLSVKGPELLNMYVGQSEENVREVFAKARSAAPCVIFFDELDALAPNRGRSGDSGGVSDRIVSQLLTELDGIGGDSNVFVIGATNRPDLIEPALLRPGRFDCRVYVGVYTNPQSQLSVLKALSRKFKLHDDVILEDVVQSFPSFVSGADVSAVCTEAVMAAAHRLIRQIELGNGSDQPEACLIIQQEDFLEACQRLKPSLSTEDVALYEAMKTRK